MDKKNLTEYAKYIVKEYSRINVNWENSGVYFKLKHFIEEGVMKDLLIKSDKQETKIEILHAIKESIEEYAKTQNVDLKIKTFEQFKNKK